MLSMPVFSGIYMSVYLSAAAEVRFVEHLADKHGLEGRKTVFETLVENPHNKPVKWFRNGEEIKKTDRYGQVVSLLSAADAKLHEIVIIC